MFIGKYYLDWSTWIMRCMGVVVIAVYLSPTVGGVLARAATIAPLVWTGVISRSAGERYAFLWQPDHPGFTVEQPSRRTR